MKRGTRHPFLMPMLGCILCSTTLAQADSLAGGNHHNQNGSLSAGTGSETKDQYSTAIGKQARTEAGAHRSTAIGYRSTVGENANLSTAVGFDSKIGKNAHHSTAIGTKSIIGDGADNSTSLGADSSIGAGSAGSTALGQAAKVGTNSRYSTAIGHRSEVGNDVTAGTALGDFANVQADNGAAIGYRARANVANSVALGSGSIANIGAETDYSAFGLAAPQDSVGEVAVGTAMGNRTITGVAAGTRDHDAVNVKQLKAVDQFSVKYDEAAPGVPDYTQITLGQGAVAETPVLLRNVRAGTISPSSYDAVNGSQIHAISERIASAFGGDSVVLSDGTITSPSYSIGGNTYNNVGSALSALDQRMGSLSAEINREAGRAGAVGLATANLRYDDRPGKFSVSAGAGVWNNYGAVAFGGGYTSMDQRIRANVSAVTSGDQWGGGAGISFTLN